MDTAFEHFAKNPSCWPRQLAEMTDILVDEVRQIFPTASDYEARCAGMRLVARFAREYGGSTCYFPKDDAIDRALRDVSIWSEFDGTTRGPNGIKALSRRYKLSDNAVWKALREQRALHQEENDISPERWRRP